MAETVVVLRQLLQQHPQHADVMRRLARMLDTVPVPAARASLVWMLGEFPAQLGAMAPDALRRLALRFAHEQTTVKNQILNLAVRPRRGGGCARTHA